MLVRAIDTAARISYHVRAIAFTFVTLRGRIMDIVPSSFRNSSHDRSVKCHADIALCSWPVGW